MSDDKSPEKIVITNRKTVWVAYTNTDCTEGRGYDIPIAVCELEVTARRLARGRHDWNPTTPAGGNARRLARGRHVQGSDGPVWPVDLLEINGKWYAPSEAFYVKEPTRDDDKEQARLDAKREALEKARAAGLTDADLAALKEG